MPAMVPPLRLEPFAADDAKSVEGETRDGGDTFDVEEELEVDSEATGFVEVGEAVVAMDAWEVGSGNFEERACWFHITAEGCVESCWTLNIGLRNMRTPPSAAV